MGARLRLRSDYPFSCSPPCEEAQAIVRTLKVFGVIVADSDSTGYKDMGLHGEWTPAGTGWDNSDIINLQTIPISAFEVVDESTHILCPTSYTWSSSGVQVCPGDEEP